MVLSCRLVGRYLGVELARDAYMARALTHRTSSWIYLAGGAAVGLVAWRVVVRTRQRHLQLPRSLFTRSLTAESASEARENAAGTLDRGASRVSSSRNESPGGESERQFRKVAPEPASPAARSGSGRSDGSERPEIRALFHPEASEPDRRRQPEPQPSEQSASNPTAPESTFDSLGASVRTSSDESRH